MNEEKLTEAAKNYAVNTVGEYDEDFPELNLNELDSECQSAFKAGVRWHESLPLAERLTEEEKEKIRHLYHHYDDEYKDEDFPSTNYTFALELAFKSIFGKTLFYPTEQ